LSRDAEDLLRSHPWPGNTRELENAIERALILTEGGLLAADHFGIGGTGEPRRGAANGQPVENSAPESLASLEQRAILSALTHAKGNKTHAAARLGITRTQLRTRLKRFGITPEGTD
jgi:DNA-binding NtrC family response regulator